MAINRTNTLYKGVDTTILTDEQINAALSRGIQVASKIKAQSVADADTGVEAYVVDAYDIDWKGYKIGDTEVRNTNDVLTALSGEVSSAIQVENTTDTTAYADVF